MGSPACPAPLSAIRVACDFPSRRPTRCSTRRSTPWRRHSPGSSGRGPEGRPQGARPAADDATVARASRSRPRIVTVGRGRPGPWHERLMRIEAGDLRYVDLDAGAVPDTPTPDVLVLLPSIGADDARNIAQAWCGRSAIFAAASVRPDLADVRTLPGDPAAVDPCSLRTRINAAAAAARGKRPTTAWRGIAPVDPTPDGVRDVSTLGVDVALFVGAAGAARQLETCLACAKHMRVPLVVAVHHTPSRRAAFRSEVSRFGRTAATVLPADPRGLEPGLYFVPAPLGRERPGPDLDVVATNLADAGLVVFECIGSGAGDKGLWGARAVADAGGTVVALEPASCAVPELVEAALAEGLCAATLSPSVYAATLRQVVPRVCAANDLARRSPAA
ncbi:MAG: hypothetical protein D6705_06850 [Deltaproteobacteria bacterium]|nr:MAG: hypothetical protein D6705_06850 [Deltaproteobacteria bacterium]